MNFSFFQNSFSRRGRGGALILFCAFSLASCMSSPSFVKGALPAVIFFEGKPVKPPARALKAGSYNIMYAAGFVQSDAEMLPGNKFKKKKREEKKAEEYYIRGVRILRKSFEAQYPGVNEAYENGNLDDYLQKFTKEDVPFLYWITAGTLGAYALDPLGDFSGEVNIEELTLLIKRAYELDPDFNHGAIDDFFILFYGSLPPEFGGDRELAKKYFKSAVEKSGGRSASPYVSAASSIAVPEQDYEAFKKYLNEALAVDISSGSAEEKLANKLSRKKARYMLDNARLYFVLN